MQPGFDAGYAFGARLGQELGALRGMAAALLWTINGLRSRATLSSESIAKQSSAELLELIAEIQR